MCDVHSEVVQKLARSIAEQAPDTRQRAVLAFVHAQNAVLYRVGIFGDMASESLQRGYGSCSNKANVLVALLRALRIPAGFAELHVNGKGYLLWPTDLFGHRIERCKKLLSEFSHRTRHFFVLVRLGGEWLRVDPSDDLRLSRGGRHCLKTLEPVVFDGYTNACLQINPADVITPWDPKSDPMSSIDDQLLKRQKAPHLRVCVPRSNALARPSRSLDATEGAL